MKSQSIEIRSTASRAAAKFLPDRHLYNYAKYKMQWDPAYAFLGTILMESNLPVTDLGCGPGVFAAWLRECGASFNYKGIDLSADKIEIANRCVSSKWPATEFCGHDAASFAEEGRFEGNIVCLDILHYFSSRDQFNLLRNLASALPAGARIFLRNGVRDAIGWRHLATSVEEAFVRCSSWIRGGEWNFPTCADVENTLKAEGLRVVAVPMWGSTPFSSYLFVAGRGQAME